MAERPPVESLARLSDHVWLTALHGHGSPGDIRLAVAGCIVVCAVASGSAVLRDELRGDADLHAGDIVVSTSPHDLAVVCRPSGRVNVAVISMSALAQAGAGGGLALRGATRIVGGAEAPSAQALATVLEAAVTLSRLFGDALADSIGYAITDSLMQVVSAAMRSEDPPPATVACRYTARALAHMREHLTAPLTLDRLAQVAGCSARTLQLAFTRDLGCSPMEALRCLRLDAAHQLLTTRDALSVTEVASGLGFTNFGRFSRQFRQRFGISPSCLQRASGRRQAAPTAPRGGSAAAPSLRQQPHRGENTALDRLRDAI